MFACRHKHKSHRKDHTEDVADANITDEDSLRHGVHFAAYFIACYKQQNFVNGCLPIL